MWDQIAMQVPCSTAPVLSRVSDSTSTPSHRPGGALGEQNSTAYAHVFAAAWDCTMLGFQVKDLHDVWNLEFCALRRNALVNFEVPPPPQVGPLDRGGNNWPIALSLPCTNKNLCVHRSLNLLLSEDVSLSQPFVELCSYATALRPPTRGAGVSCRVRDADAEPPTAALTLLFILYSFRRKAV
jgi:hypothetical protein